MSDSSDMNLKQSVFNKARKDKFLLIFTLPPILRDLNIPILALQNNDKEVKQDAMQYSIYGSPVPDIVVPAVTMNYDGQPYKVTSQARQAYPPILVNFTIDNRFANWWVIWKWLDKMNLHRDSGMYDYFSRWEDTKIQANNLRKTADRLTSKDVPSGEYKQEIKEMANNFLAYQTTFSVFALDEFDNKIVKFNYYNAFPTTLGGIQYNYRDHTEAESNFQFEFSQMDVNLITDDGQQ